ncbi:RND family efflux transporter MFP subunit [Paenibacillus castaneae]|uniref:efflux RND transporter periplasmic adaptor subunit n=1 Tax=Paenibacillus castaneae TaxID=474957 RepID=UPI000C9C937B|nr:efflux RND transporter periplasmic adaptor subunit [Paenibacillus castaneae]NIK77020.1 RND family efflux transporter MFP subunit [Paenibacillus castaneae]
MEKLYRKRLTINKRRRLLPNACCVAVALAATLLFSGCGLLPVEQEALQPPLVQPAQEKLDIVKASRGMIQTYLKGTAHFVSSSAENLSFKDSGGRLKSINVTVGQEVKAGDLLVEQETGDLDLQVGLQRLNLERAQLLFKQAYDAEASQIDLRLREIDLEREKMSLQSMETRLQKSRLYASISGTVTFVETMNAGDFVNAYQSIVTIADTSRMQLSYVAADMKEVHPVEAGMPVNLKYKGTAYTGKVLQAPSNVPVTANNSKMERNAVTLYMSMDNKPDGINIGDSAELMIELQKRENAIILPRSAIRSYMGRYYVQVLDGERRKEVDIEVGLITPTEAEVVKGLEEGQQVILNN